MININKKIKYLHIFPKSFFFLSYFKMIEKHFDLDEHCFVLTKRIHDVKIDDLAEFGNVIDTDLLTESQMYRHIKGIIKKSNKIFLHNLPNSRRLRLFFILNKKESIKLHWIIWGADLYQKRKSMIGNRFHACLLNRINYYVTCVRGDYEIASGKYNCKAIYEHTFYPYLLNASLIEEVNKIKRLPNDSINILVGNSADASNEHVEVFNLLKKRENQKLRVICPLTYGDGAYRRRVIEEGFSLFGENFLPITTHLEGESYVSLLSEVDVAIFNHKRQQAMGNIITLLAMGKTIYLRDKIATWTVVEDVDLYVRRTEDILSIPDERLLISERESILNVKRTKEAFSEANCIKSWFEIFE